jgi:hypothetical protein
VGEPGLADVQPGGGRGERALVRHRDEVLELAKSNAYGLVVASLSHDLVPRHAPAGAVGADGQPQVTAIWAMLDGDVVRTSLYKGRQ